MSKYRVGDELIIIKDTNKENKKLQELTKLIIDDDFAQISWGIKIINIEFEKTNIILTYKNGNDELNKVFAECHDIENFDKQKIVEKALLKAFQNEIIDISVAKNQ